VEAPERCALIFLGDGEKESERLSYRQLASRASAVAARIGAEAAPGERVLLLLKPGPDYLAAFLGCLWARAVPVPAYPPRPGRNDGRSAAIVASARSALALVDDPGW